MQLCFNTDVCPLDNHFFVEEFGARFFFLFLLLIHQVSFLKTLSFPLSCRILYLLLLNVGISKKGVGDEWTTLSFTFLTISNKTFHLQFENYKGSFSFQSHLKLIWMFTDYLFHLFLWRNSFERLCEQKASCISLVGENTHINSQFNPLRKSPRLVFTLALDQYFEIGHYIFSILIVDFGW